jgi:hypothetical protein
MLMLSNAALEGMVEAMEEVLVANPDDLFSHRSYADTLIKHRDPACTARGRLIELQLKLEQGVAVEAERKKLERRGKKLLKDNGRAWLGSLAPWLLDGQGLDGSAEYTFDFARGWLSRLTAPVLDPGFVRALARAPQARLLQQLVIEETSPGGLDALVPLLDASFLPHLRGFWLGPVASFTPNERALLDELVARMVSVEELYTPWHRRPGAPQSV